MALSPTDSLTDAIRPVAAGAHVTAAAFLGRTPALALGDGAVVVVTEAGEQRFTAHPGGAILIAISQDGRLLTGGDDGRVVATDAEGRSEEIAHEQGKWIDALTARPDGAIAWASGRQVRARSAKGEVRAILAGSSVRGLSFAPKGYRLAFAHYNGASLWFPNTEQAPQSLIWKGSHIDAIFSPDGRFLITSMQENALHGWRLADEQHMRMTGYPSKVRSWSWSHDGNWLATSGADACVVWPFESKTGPMGKAPRECGVRPVRVSQVAFHPKTLILALGYEDGFILLCRLTDGAEILVRKTSPDVTDAISAMAWDRDGTRLLFGTAEGNAGLVTLPG